MFQAPLKQVFFYNCKLRVSINHLLIAAKIPLIARFFQKHLKTEMDILIKSPLSRFKDSLT